MENVGTALKTVGKALMFKEIGEILDVFVLFDDDGNFSWGDSMFDLLFNDVCDEFILQYRRGEFDDFNGQVF